LQGVIFLLNGVLFLLLLLLIQLLLPLLLSLLASSLPRPLALHLVLIAIEVILASIVIAVRDLKVIFKASQQLLLPQGFLSVAIFLALTVILIEILFLSGEAELLQLVLVSNGLNPSLEVPDNVLVVEPADHCDLSDDSLVLLLIGPVQLHLLDGIDVPVYLVSSLEHSACSPLSYLLKLLKVYFVP
jgi:hypothetical protein